MHGTIDIEPTIAAADAQYPALFQLFGGYFHQDWRAESASSDEALQRYLDEASPQAVNAAAEELQGLLGAGWDDEDLGRLLREGFDCNHVPDGGAQATREWLVHVLERLRGR